MRLTPLATGALLTASLATRHLTPDHTPGRAAPEHHFALVLEHSGSRWAAHCDVGCKWTEVALTCSGCAVRIDAAGIAPAAAPRDTAEPFAFELRAARSGWVARGLAGVRWAELSSQCGRAACRARIDEAGVAGL